MISFRDKNMIKKKKKYNEAMSLNNGVLEKGKSDPS